MTVENEMRTRRCSLVHNPFVSATGIRTHVIQFHLLFSGSTLALEKDSLRMTAFRASVILRSWQCGVGDNVGDNLSEGVNFVRNLVDVDTRILSGHTEFTISTAVHENPVLLVFFGIEHVVTLLTKPYPDETRSFFGEPRGIKEVLVRFSLHSYW